MVDDVTEVCGFLKAGRKNRNIEWWNDAVKSSVEREEAPWKEKENNSKKLGVNELNYSETTNT